MEIGATVIVEDQDKGGNIFGSASGALQDFSSLLNTKSSVDNEAQILQTRDLVEKVVRNMELNIVYYRDGLVHKIELYPRHAFFTSTC